MQTETQERHRDPRAALKPRANSRWISGVVGGLLDETADAAEHRERDEEAHGQERRELHQQFGGDGDDQPFLVLRGVDMARAEEDGERRHEQRDHKRRVDRDAEQRAVEGRRAGCVTDNATALSCSAM